MIKSMTGYGGAKGSVEGLEISVEIKSVNNRYLDSSVRLPRSFLFAEDPIRSTVQKHISRGKVDVFVTISSSGAEEMTVKVDKPLLDGYVKAIRQIAEDYGLAPDMSAMALSRIPDVLTVEKKELDADAISEGICQVTEKALEDLDKMRLREGEKLKEDILGKLQLIEELVAKVEQESPRTLAEYRTRLENKLQEVLGSTDIDQSRMLTEAAIFADRVAVDEETVRLHSHMSQMRQMLSGGSPTGRKLDFLIQEFNREANTIGSKCQSSQIAHVVVDIKSEIEKIREQIQNIE